ncbi:MAG: hypothetical protein KAH01_05800 [Caldisericia bacterium]|nr:hypothetical protein [Caldisericia bacterium]
MSKLQLTENGNTKRFTRSEVKYPFMQAGYGQREKGTKAQLEADMAKGKYDKNTYPLFVQAVEQIVPGFYTLLEFVNDSWDPESILTTFVLPDGFKVQCKPTSADWYEFKPLGLFPITAKVGGVAKEDETLILWVSIIHSIDAYIARQVIARCDFPIITIHDAFRCHPNNTKKMKKAYNEIMAEINEGRLFEDIMQQITGQTINTIGTNITTKDILKAKYSIC